MLDNNVLVEAQSSTPQRPATAPSPSSSEKSNQQSSPAHGCKGTSRHRPYRNTGRSPSRRRTQRGPRSPDEQPRWHSVHPADREFLRGAWQRHQMEVERALQELEWRHQNLCMREARLLAAENELMQQLGSWGTGADDVHSNFEWNGNEIAEIPLV